ncbi:hypothetical protein IQ07DRAFT_597765 [Pyrenochaeta sp. DS3sAY3a]|nr:hypothetical protein IQ07DRAFT_597765 [Pyrenochaeta sp. DS3sAY3a]
MTPPSSRPQHDASAPLLSQPNSFERLKNRLRKMWQVRRLRAAQKKHVESMSLGEYERVALILADVNEVQRQNKGVIMFDTGSDHNLVSEDFLNRAFPDLAYGGKHYEPFAEGVAGEALMSKGTVQLAWYCGSARCPGKGPRTRSKFETGTFQIVKTNHYEIIVGRPDIERLKLFPANRERFGHVATIVAATTKVNGCDAAQDEAAAAARREKEKKEKEERKKKLKEEAARRQ